MIFGALTLYIIVLGLTFCEELIECVNRRNSSFEVILSCQHAHASKATPTHASKATFGAAFELGRHE